MLYAFGDDKDPLPETVRVLDEMVTDYIIEICHTATKAAEVSGRQKLKVDDFKFAIRNDEIALGKVRDLFKMEKLLKESRKQFDDGEGKIGLERGGRKRKVDEAELDASVAAKETGGVEDDVGEDDLEDER